MSILQRFIYVAHPLVNGKVEVTNHTIFDGIKKRLVRSKEKWVEELDTVLWAYRTNTRTTTRETRVALVYGGEAVIPTEIIFNSPWIETYEEQTNEITHIMELDCIDLKREIALIRAKKSKSEVRASYNKKVHVRRFEKWELVM